MAKPTRPVMIVAGVIVVLFLVLVTVMRSPAPPAETAVSVAAEPRATPSVSASTDAAKPAAKRPAQRTVESTTAAPRAAAPATDAAPLTEEEKLKALHELMDLASQTFDLEDSDFVALAQTCNISRPEARELHARVQRQVDLLEMGVLPREPYARWFVDGRPTFASSAMRALYLNNDSDPLMDKHLRIRWASNNVERFENLTVAALITFCSESQLAEMRRSGIDNRPMSESTRERMTEALVYLNLYVGRQVQGKD